MAKSNIPEASKQSIMGIWASPKIPASTNKLTKSVLFCSFEISGLYKDSQNDSRVKPDLSRASSKSSNCVLFRFLMKHSS